MITARERSGGGLSGRPRPLPKGREPAVQVVDDPVEGDHVECLDHPHVVDPRMHVDVIHLLELTATEPGDSHRGQVVGVGPLDSPEDVRAVARPRDRQQDVAGRGQVLELLDEDPVIPSSLPCVMMPAVLSVRLNTFSRRF